jgi:hypothetical protein
MGCVETKGTLQEALFEGAGNDDGRNGDAFVSRGFGNKCVRASAARNLNPRVVYDRSPIKETGRCRASPRHRHLQRTPENAQGDLIRKAHRHEEDFTIIEGDRSPALNFGIFVAFAMIYPRVELFLRIVAKWIALILTGVYTFQLLAYHAWSDLTVVWTSIGAAFLFIELRGAGPELAWWNNLKARFGPKPKFHVVQKARPRRAAESDDVYCVDRSDSRQDLEIRHWKRCRHSRTRD